MVEIAEVESAREDGDGDGEASPEECAPDR